MSFVRQRTAPIREKRLGSIAAWYGSVGSLVREADDGGLVQRIRTFAQDTPSDLILGLELLSTLEGIAIVVHGPAGCAASLHQAQGSGPHWVVSNVNERDSILGGDAKLRRAIRQVHADFSPRAIVVVASPVVIINNDDIDSVTEELRDELGIPLIPVFTDGFRSKVAATGFDVVVHALLKYLLPPEQGKTGEHINLLSLSDSPANVASLQTLLAGIGIDSQPFPRFLNVDDARLVADARLSIAIDAGESDYAGVSLQQLFETPYLAPPAPVGVAATSQWLSAVGEATGRSKQAEALINKEVQALTSQLQAAAHLRGRKVFINLPAGQAISFWHLAQEFGLDVIGIKVPFLDPAHVAALREIASSNEALPILVGAGQAFEEISLLKNQRPDLYVSKGVDALSAARLGIATLPLDEQVYLGFSGVSNLLQQIEHRLANTHFQRFLAEGDNEPYTGSWLKKSAYWYIKHEVK